MNYIKSPLFYFLGAILLSTSLTYGQAPIKFEIPLECLKCHPDSGIYKGHRLSTYYDHGSRGSKMDYMGGEKTYDGHKGNDFSLKPFHLYQMDSMYVSAVAAAPGIITKKVDGHYDRVCAWDDPLRESWNYVEVRHSTGIRSIYGHLAKNTLTSRNVGDSVNTGDYLGIIGSSGRSGNVHLHFEVRDSTGQDIDPFQGPENSAIEESWWKEQPVYPEPVSLNWIMTGSAPPDRKDCPEHDQLNRKKHFKPGDTLVGSFYFNHAIAVSSTLTTRLIRPDNKVWDSLSGGIRALQNWTHVIPQDAPLGKWTFELLHRDSTYDVPFYVNQKATGLAVKEASGAEIPANKNYPDPFKAATTISWQTEKGGHTKLVIYNGVGKPVRKLMDTYKKPGKYKRSFHAETLPGGMYFYKLQIGDALAIGKMTKIR